MRCAFYMRTDRGNQDDSHDLGIHEADAERFVRARAGVIVPIYEDASPDHRTAFRRVVDDARAGAFDAVATHGMEQDERAPRDSSPDMATLQKLDTRVHMFPSPQPIEPRATVDGIHEMIAQIMSQQHAARMAQLVRQGLAPRAHSGLHVGAPPYGYSMEGARLRANGDLTAVRLALEIYVDRDC